MGSSSRDRFRSAVFARDRGRCVACGKVAVDAHHLLERRLWTGGGYVVDNGVALCAGCHLRAERTLASVEDLRLAAGITEVVLPSQCDPSLCWDKWGNPYLPWSLLRAPGELFFEPGVRRLLRSAGVLGAFEAHEVPTWRPTRSADDPSLAACSVRYHVPVDGARCVLYADGFELVQPAGEPLGAAVLRAAGNRRRLVSSQLPTGWRLEGWLRAEDVLVGELLWEQDHCHSWSETSTWLSLLGVEAPGSGSATAARCPDGFAASAARKQLAFLARRPQPTIRPTS